MPEDFIDYANQIHGSEVEVLPSRLIVEVTDPTSEEIQALFDGSSYETDKELLRLNKLRTTANFAVWGMLFLAVLFIIFGVYVFSLFIELSVAQAGDSIQKLILLGYSPVFLTKYIFFRHALIMIATMVCSGVLAIVAQVRAAKYIIDENLFIAKFPTWEVWTALGAMTLLLLILLHRIIANRVHR